MTALPDARVNKNVEGPGLRAKIQKFGGYLAGMIMPNIGAFIAWGLITAMFIETGWLPNATLAGLVGPMLYFLLPILIGYTGGKMVHGQRGAVIGAIATAGVIIGGITEFATLTGTPMFLGAMIMGPFAGWVLKQFDKAIEVQTRAVAAHEARQIAIYLEQSLGELGNTYALMEQPLQALDSAARTAFASAVG